MLNQKKWKEYFNLRKERYLQIGILVDKYKLKGDKKKISDIILDWYEAIPSMLDTTPLDLFKIIYACINEKNNISIKFSNTNIHIEGPERIQGLVPILEETFIKEINKPHNKPYFIVLMRYLKWVHNNTRSHPTKIIPQTLSPYRTISNTEEYHVYNESNNKLELVGIAHEHVDKIFNSITNIKHETKEYYISYLLDSLVNILKDKQIFNSNLKFISNKEAAFLYDLLLAFGINNLSIQIGDITNVEKRDVIRSAIRRVNKSIYIK